MRPIHGTGRRTSSRDVFRVLQNFDLCQDGISHARERRDHVWRVEVELQLRCRCRYGDWRGWQRDRAGRTRHIRYVFLGVLSHVEHRLAPAQISRVTDVCFRTVEAGCIVASAEDGRHASSVRFVRVARATTEVVAQRCHSRLGCVSDRLLAGSVTLGGGYVDAGTRSVGVNERCAVSLSAMAREVKTPVGALTYSVLLPPLMDSTAAFADRAL